MSDTIEQSEIEKKEEYTMATLRLREQVALRKLLWVGPLTIVLTIIANLILRTIAVSFFWNS